jgi:hypothetical protein
MTDPTMLAVSADPDAGPDWPVATLCVHFDGTQSSAFPLAHGFLESAIGENAAHVEIRDWAPEWASNTIWQSGDHRCTI